MDSFQDQPNFTSALDDHVLEDIEHLFEEEEEATRVEMANANDQLLLDEMNLSPQSSLSSSTKTTNQQQKIRFEGEDEEVHPTTRLAEKLHELSRLYPKEEGVKLVKSSNCLDFGKAENEYESAKLCQFTLVDRGGSLKQRLTKLSQTYAMDKEEESKSLLVSHSSPSLIRGPKSTSSQHSELFKYNSVTPHIAEVVKATPASEKVSVSPLVKQGSVANLTKLYEDKASNNNPLVERAPELLSFREKQKFFEKTSIKEQDEQATKREYQQKVKGGQQPKRIKMISQWEPIRIDESPEKVEKATQSGTEEEAEENTLIHESQHEEVPESHEDDEEKLSGNVYNFVEEQLPESTHNELKTSPVSTKSHVDLQKPFENNDLIEETKVSTTIDRQDEKLFENVAEESELLFDEEEPYHGPEEGEKREKLPENLIGEPISANDEFAFSIIEPEKTTFQEVDLDHQFYPNQPMRHSTLSSITSISSSTMTTTTTNYTLDTTTTTTTCEPENSEDDLDDYEEELNQNLVNLASLDLEFAPPMRTISHYRWEQKQQMMRDAQKFSSPSQVHFCNQSIPEEEEPEGDQLVESSRGVNQLEVLQQKMAKYKVILEQASNALINCPETAGSELFEACVEAHKLRLVYGEKLKACSKWIDSNQHLKSESSSHANLYISDIAVPFKKDLLNRSKPKLPHRLICLIYHGAKVYPSPLLNPSAYLSQCELQFDFDPHPLQIANLSEDFEVRISLFELKNSKKRKLSKKNSIVSSPLMKNFKEVLTSSSGYHNSLKRKNSNLKKPENFEGFSKIGTVSLRLGDLRGSIRSLYKLESVKPSPILEGYLTLNLEIELDFQHSSIRAYYDVKDQENDFWNARFVVLTGSLLRYWRFETEVQDKSPLGEIDLKACINPTVQLLSGELKTLVCRRANTLALVCCEKVSRKSSKGQSGSLREFSTHLISSIEREKALELCQKLNSTLHTIRTWQTSKDIIPAFSQQEFEKLLTPH